MYWDSPESRPSGFLGEIHYLFATLVGQECANIEKRPNIVRHSLTYYCGYRFMSYSFNYLNNSPASPRIEEH